MARAFLLILDSFGIGGAPDAASFGDAGANTLGHICERMPLHVPLRSQIPQRLHRLHPRETHLLKTRAVLAMLIGFLAKTLSPAATRLAKTQIPIAVNTIQDHS